MKSSSAQFAFEYSKVYRPIPIGYIFHNLAFESGVGLGLILGLESSKTFVSTPRRRPSESGLECSRYRRLVSRSQDWFRTITF